MSAYSGCTEVERRALESFLRGDATPPASGEAGDAWIGFGLRCLLEAGRTLRTRAPYLERFERKHDGSPVTKLEHEIERGIRDRLRAFAPSASFVGEESGGRMPDAGFVVAVDPVDGTWALLSETSSWTSVIAVLEDGDPFAAFVANPTTGELAYALRDRPARLLRLPAFGEPLLAHTLPTRPPGEGATLVHVHPSRDSRTLRATLLGAFERGELGVVRSAGGSPTWGMIEAARGHYVYLNTWSPAPAEPYDLVAGALIVRCAGGEVTDANDEPIDATRHAGPWLAAIDPGARARVAALVRDSWPTARSTA